MPLWRLEYYVDDSPTRLRSTTAEFDDLLGENIRQAHEHIRKIGESKGENQPTLRFAVLVTDPEYDRDPLDGEPKIPVWITYAPFHPDDDPDDESLDQPRRRERFDFPARLFDTQVDATGKPMTFGPSIGQMKLAIRRRLGDGREGAIFKTDHSEEDEAG